MWVEDDDIDCEGEMRHVCLHPLIRGALRRRGLLGANFEAFAWSMGKSACALAFELELDAQDRDLFGYHVETLVEIGMDANELVSVLRYKRPTLQRVQ